MSKQNVGLYSNTLQVPAKKVAGTNPIVGPVLGSDVTRLVPKRQPRLTGLSGGHGYGHAPHQRFGKLRLSGSKRAHRIGG